jgi:hypothetical protein
MLPPDQRMLLYLEDISSATIGPSRFVDYTAVVTSQCLACNVLNLSPTA